MNKLAKRIVAVALALCFALSFAACGNKDKNGSTVKVGAILVGDETEGYTLAHMNGMEAAVKALAKEGIDVELSYKKKVPESEEVATNASDLVADGCQVVITNSYGHQYNWGDVIKQNPDVQFVSMTGDLAATSGLKNYHNAFTKIYESRYVSGVVAGLKIKELVDSGKLTKETAPNAFDENGNIKLGWVGAYPYAEVVSGYTAFFLGVKSIVSNVAMTVKYTNSWFSEEREAAVAEYLMGIGCVIIGQHADSTGAPAAVEKAYQENNNLLCYSIGYNVSMLDAAPDVALTSSCNNWEVYYEYLFRAIAKGEEVPTDWSEGYSKN
ncbi:MAG TPA: BMP family ABC transporter substrate-binding protein, partial [Clostridiales bacterium]|nr:BMP family ABC transporter substrate-binding protein [Clostridiales bacterium]